MNEYKEYPRIIREAKYGRVYEIAEGAYVPSVTTVLKYGLPTPEFLMKWMMTYIHQSIAHSVVKRLLI